MIPKIIHYCWFGGNPLPQLALECIDSWKTFCPDYKIIEWNESNFDLNCCDFVKEAYEAKKWAFVSDYARLKIVYDEGGIYLDTDVKVIKCLDTLLVNKCFLGEEASSGLVATGLGFGAEKENLIIKEMLDVYTGTHFKLDNNHYDMTACPEKNTRPLSKYGYSISNDKIWKIENAVVYPPEYFSPLDYQTGEKRITNNTYSIHLYNASWHTWIEDVIVAIERGNAEESSLGYKIRRIASLPFRVVNKIYNKGLKNAWACAVEKVKRENRE